MTTRRPLPLLAVVSALLAPALSANADILLDGDFDDWAGVPLLAGDPTATASGLTATSVSAQSIGSRLFLRFTIGDQRNLPAGEFTDGELAIEILIEDEQNPDEFQVILSHAARARAFRTGPVGTAPLISQQMLGAFYAPTYASNEFEMVLDLAPVGIQQGDTIHLRLTGLPISQPFTLAEPPAPEPIRPIERPTDTDLRILSWNTLNNGAITPARQPRFERIIIAFQPDILLLQEEYTGGVGFYTGWLNGFDPLNDDRPWNVIKSGDNVIATPYQLLPLIAADSRYAAALVILDDDRSVIVINLHAKCCGYTGNSDDQQRITTSVQIIETIRQLRDGELGPLYEPHRDAPVVVAGDWNLVGSRTPLDLIEQSPITDAQAITIPQQVGRTTATWRSSRTTPTFLPGRLDLFAADSDAIETMNAFAFDSARVPQSLLDQLVLLPTDTDASDHYPLIVDLAFQSPPCPADINRDRTVDADDYQIFIANFGAGPGATLEQGDVNNDGFINLADFNIIAVQFGSTCPD